MPGKERGSRGHWEGFHLGGSEYILIRQMRRGLSDRASRVIKEGKG